MPIASSAKSRYEAHRSASLKTATTSIPRSRQARITRSAISPRLATRMRWNMGSSRFDAEEHLAVLDRLLVLDKDFGDDAVALRLDLVEDLHGLDQADDRCRGHSGSDANERFGIRGGSRVESAGRRTFDRQKRLGGFRRVFGW